MLQTEGGGIMILDILRWGVVNKRLGTTALAEMVIAELVSDTLLHFHSALIARIFAIAEVFCSFLNFICYFIVVVMCIFIFEYKIRKAIRIVKF